MSPPRNRRPRSELAPPRRRHRLRRQTRARRRRGVRIVLAVLLVAVPLVLVAGGFTATVAFRSSCDLESLRPVVIGQNSFVYAADGSLLGSIPAERNRQPVPLDRVSPWMHKATVAIEDRRFYRHGGVDYEGIARALLRDIQAGRVVEGGSTITQQLVRNLYISRERTLSRKIREACLALKLNRHWSKDRILAAYMNQVYYGAHAYGIEAAAQTYFSKHARDLNLKQAALLAGLPQAPSRYDPFNRPGDALARRDQVLRAMLENGDIDREQYEWAVRDRDLRLRAGKLYTEIREPYFFSYVRDELIAEYGANTVRSGGLRVYTTIDPAFQRAARQAIQDTLYEKTDPAAALVAINPANGAIRAMTAVVPGRKGLQFNLAAQARRPSGSTFKTFVLAAAVEQGINPATTTYLSAPFRYRPDPYTEAWDVSTYDHSYIGWTSVERATLRSDNAVYAQLTLDVGPERVADMARRLGVRSRLDVDGAYVPSIGLGALSVSPLEMASAYATLAAGGIYSRPMAIRKVVLASGKEDTDAGWGRPDRRRAVPEWVASVVTEILEDNVRWGTGTAAAIGRPAAGKTGTTENHADAWFCGYTPNLQATVWIGYPQAQIPMRNVHGISVSGGSFPAQIWGRFMSRALRYSPAAEWPEAQGEPEWKPFTRGQYGRTFLYVPSADDESEEETTTSTSGTTTSAPATTAASTTTATTKPKPATTTAPPPATTTAPAPATTTAPPATTEPPPATTEPQAPEEPGGL